MYNIKKRDDHTYCLICSEMCSRYIIQIQEILKQTVSMGNSKAEETKRKKYILKTVP